jgi:putative ABC transport system permease protein
MAFLRRTFWLLRRISLPHLRQHTLRTVLTLVGVASGVSAVVATSVVSDSAFKTFEDATRATAGSAQIYVGNRGAGVPEALVEEIKRLDGIVHVAPLIHGLLDHSDTKREPVTVFGFDVLGDDGWTDQLTDDAIEIDDELEFIAQPDSIVAARTLAAEEGLSLGDSIRLLTPTGPQELVVRGFVEDVGPIPLFSGRVILMDLPAVQLLMAKDRKVDRIDITLADGALVEPSIAAIKEVVAGRGLVRETSMLGRRAKDALRTMRMVIARPGVMAVIVGFFIIFHTMSVSVTQRRHELTLLDALGYGPGVLVSWLAIEGAVLGLIGSLAGLASGIGLGAVSLQFFDEAVASWVRLPEPELHITARGVGLALAAGLGTSVFATIFAGRRWFARRASNALASISKNAPRRQIIRATGVAISGMTIAFAMIVLVPADMSDTQVSTYINVVNVLVLASLGFFARSNSSDRRYRLEPRVDTRRRHVH